MRRSQTRRGVLALTATVAAAALLLTACSGRGGPAESGGEADTSPIVIGASWPQSGPAASVAPGLAGLEAYIEGVNADGGVDGREIELVAADDAYDPARLVENQRKFVEKDGAIAVVNFGGISIAGRDYLKGASVAGFSLAGNTPLSDIEGYPLQRAWWPDVSWEGELQAKWLTENHPDAVVGYIGFNNDLTESHLEGLAAGGVTPVGVAKVAPGTSDLSAQVSEFQAKGVDTVLINIGAPTIGAVLGYMHQIGWEPTRVLAGNVADFHTAINPAGPEAVDGAYSFSFGKDPSDPAYAEDPDIAEYTEAMRATGHEKDAPNALALNGYGLGAAIVQAIRNADEITSEGVVEAWDSFEGEENPFLRDGMTLTGGTGGRVNFQYQFTQFDGTSWVPSGEIQDVAELGIAK